MKYIVIIPVYKDNINELERLSLVQCLKVLNRYDICLCSPSDIDLSLYRELFLQCNKVFRVEFFENLYFKGVEGYNRLMLSSFFYSRFSNYEYMLVYQLDAYVFRDELEYWCLRKYDYIGAPWFNKDGSLCDLSCGNGGFSLRKIETFLSLFKIPHSERLLTLKGLLYYYRYSKPLPKLKCVLEGFLGLRNSLDVFLMRNMINEDFFYSALKFKRNIGFNIPASIDAMFFKREKHPMFLFKKTKGRLPFGCHAWYRYDYDSFWEKFINLKR